MREERYWEMEKGKRYRLCMGGRASLGSMCEKDVGNGGGYWQEKFLMILGEEEERKD